MDWAKLGELSVGLAAAALILWIVLVKAKNGNGGHKSAGLTANEWKLAINAEVKKALDETAAKRHEDLRKVFKDVLEHELLQRNKEILDKILGDLQMTRHDLRGLLSQSLDRMELRRIKGGE